MTTKYLTGAYAGGYTLKAGFTGVYVETTASVGGIGLVVNTNLAIGNHGSLVAGTKAGDFGIKLTAGGLAANYATISGYDGVFGSSGTATNVYNEGTITGVNSGVLLAISTYIKNVSGSISGSAYGVVVLGGSVSVNNSGTIVGSSGRGIEINGGTILNGGYIAGTLIGAQTNAAAYVGNYGSILGLTLGAYLKGGGTLVNTAEIYGLTGDGAKVIGGSVKNLGTIAGSGVGLTLNNSASLTNGSVTDHQALISGGGFGLVASGASGLAVNFGSIVNTGTGAGYAAVYESGGEIVNAASGVIRGDAAMTVAGAGVVVNYGFIDSTDPYLFSTPGIYGIHFTNGGILQNGSALYRSGLIEGIDGGVLIGGAAGTVSNFAEITATDPGQGGGVVLVKGGKVTNGSLAVTNALIQGRYGVDSGGLTTIINFGTILSPTGHAVFISAASSKVVNGGASDPNALIEGYEGVSIEGAFGAVVNYGTIEARAAGAGAVTTGGGTVSNGAGGDTTALMSGAYGLIMVSGPGAVTNYGSILGLGHAGVLSTAGGSVANGRGPDTTALIRGVIGVYETALATVSNIGVIDGTTGAGVSLKAGGRVVNGGGGQKSALVEGISGVILGAAGQVLNYGTVDGGYGFGVFSAAGTANVTNGSGLNHGALIEGLVGVRLEAAGGTVKNFATVLATGSQVFDYGVQLFGDTLINGSAADSAALIEGYTGVSLYGGSTTNLGTILGAGVSSGWGAVISGGGASLVNGAASHKGAIVEGYTGVYVNGTASVTNFGTVIGDGGVAVQLNAATDTLVVEAGSAFIGSILGGGGTLELGDGAGTLSGLLAGGSVTVSGSMATTTFNNFATVKIDAPASFVVAGSGTIGSGQSLVVLGTASTAGTLSVSGSLTLGGTVGGSGTLAVLTGGKLSGSGQLGAGTLSLNNHVGGLVNANATAALVINSGAVTVVNAGTIESTSTGGLTITGAVSNTGVLLATKGTLTVDGAVTGAGTVKISGGTADFASTFSENVAFSITAGSVLELAKSQTYTGKVSGLSTTGTNSLDLLDIGFTSGTTKATYSGTATSGTLTVTDGTHTAKITLLGNYVGHTFTPSSDGHGGTKVVDPATSGGGGGGGHVVPLVTAMAAFGTGAPAGVDRATQPQTDRLPLFAAAARRA